MRLFIDRSSALSRKALDVIRSLTGDDGTYEIEVVDVMLDPEAAEAARIVATPTLVRHHPAPEIRVVGDLRHEHAGHIIATLLRPPATGEGTA